MKEESIKGVLEFTVPNVIKMIVQKQSVSEETALMLFYHSELYRQLEREQTKLWHLSALTLYDLWLEEQTTGQITYPEEA